MSLKDHATVHEVREWRGKSLRRPSEIRAVSGSSVTEPAPDVEVSEDDPICWICLDVSKGVQPLMRPCKCPRFAHAHCLARWQLQSAGSRKETHCEFCDSTLPDWKNTLTPHCGANAPAVMNVNFDGRAYSFEVKPGPDGYRQFTEAIRRAFTLPEDSELNITFTCDEPSTGSLLTLQGAGAYDAAVHCASVSAARRLLQTRPVDQPGSAPQTPQHSFRQVDASSRSSSLHSSASSASSSRLSSSSPESPQYTSQNKNRRLAGIGRKLRNAICDLLITKQ